MNQERETPKFQAQEKGPPKQYAVITRGGRCLINRGERLVEFTWNRHSESVIYHFWMNFHSVADIFDKFEKDPVNEAKYDDIFTGVRT
jgi:hypothetical protein